MWIFFVVDGGEGFFVSVFGELNVVYGGVYIECGVDWFYL